MKLLDSIRTFFHIRTKRQLAPPGAMPQIGSSIVLDNLKIKLKHPINIEQWHWFSNLGWRTIDTRNERRRYTCLSDQVLMILLEADKKSREGLYQRFVIDGEVPPKSITDDEDYGVQGCDAIETKEEDPI